jgi:Sec-independent protein secretion pathway component TatC
MAGPMIILYNLSILLSWAITSRREKADARLREQERLADEEERAARRAKQAGDTDDGEA